MKKVFYFLLCLIMLSSPLTLIHAEEMSIYSDYYYLVDMDNGQVVLDQGSEDLIYPASMTKMMTLIVGLENLKDFDETIVLDQEIFEGLYEENASMAGFYLNETVTLKDCLYGLFLPSGAECTRAVAFAAAGSEEAFVELMNQKAKDLGMNNTHFVNTTGLHDNDHKTTLRDLAILLDYCLKNSEFEEIFTTRSYLAKSGSMHRRGIKWESTTFKNIDRVGWKNLNEEVIRGGKTGYTIPAGLCLASVGEMDGRRYMLITAHAPSGSVPYHAMDTVEIYDQIFNHYKKTVLIHQETILGESEVRFNFRNSTIGFQASENIELTLPEEIVIDKIETVLNVKESYDAPLEIGDYLGSASLIYEGKEIYSFDLLVQQPIERNPLLYGLHCMMEWMLNNLILTGFILFIIGFILWRIVVNRLEIGRLIEKKSKRRKRYRY